MPRAPTKWDLVLEQKPVALLDHLVGELGALLAAEVRAWPPGIEPTDRAEAASVRALLQQHPGRPDPRAYREAFTLARWELEREIAAIDDYFRNRRYLAAGLAPEDRTLLQFLSRLLVEQLLALGEATQGRLKRPRLLEVLAGARAAVLGPSAIDPP